MKTEAEDRRKLLLPTLQAVDAQLGCSQKLVTTIALPSTGSLATEQLQYTVPCIGRWVT